MKLIKFRAANNVTKKRNVTLVDFSLKEKFEVNGQVFQKYGLRVRHWKGNKLVQFGKLNFITGNRYFKLCLKNPGT